MNACLTNLNHNELSSARRNGLSALLPDDNENEISRNENENGSKEGSGTTPFWGEDAIDDDDEDDESSNDSSASNSGDLAQRQTTGEAILSIAIPALAGLAIDPLMVRQNDMLYIQ